MTVEKKEVQRFNLIKIVKSFGEIGKAPESQNMTGAGENNFFLNEEVKSLLTGI